MLFILIDGFPYLSLTIEISLKFKPFLNPVPKAFEKASFAANLLEKKQVLLFIFCDFRISSFEKILDKNFLLEIDFLILKFSIISTPTRNPFLDQHELQVQF